MDRRSSTRQRGRTDVEITSSGINCVRQIVDFTIRHGHERQYRIAIFGDRASGVLDGGTRLAFLSGEVALIAHNPHSTPSKGLLSSTQWHLDGAVVLSVSGEVDLANEASLRAQLKAVIATGKHLIVVDLKELRYIDSSGIHVLLDAHHTLAHGGRSIVLAAVPPMVRRIFEIVGLGQMIPVFPTVETAVESLHRGKGAAGC